MSEIDTSAPEAAETPAGELEEAASRNGASVVEAPKDETPAEQTPSEDDDAVSEPSELERLKAACDQAEQERDALVGQMQRMQAEFENIRKRLYKEREEVVQYAASDTINSLLPIVDDFERAIETEGIDPEIQKGLELIHKRLFEVFSRAGLREVDQHEQFDPHLHYAVDRAPAEETQKDQEILEVYQKGYYFKDRLLRASMVKVAVKE